MPYSRQRPRIAATDRVTIRLTPTQRDMFIAAAEVSKSLGHLLHRAHVTKGELTIRVSRRELDALIAAAANAPSENRKQDRELSALLRYLEGIEDRFEETGEEATLS